MTSQNAEKSLLTSVRNEWRSSVEERINSLKKSSNKEKREECIEGILQILCRAIIQDREKVYQRSKKRRESIVWWASFIKDNASFFFVLIVGAIFLYGICLVAYNWFNQLKTMPVPTNVGGIICLFVIYILILVTFTALGAKGKIEHFLKWISKYFGS